VAVLVVKTAGWVLVIKANGRSSRELWKTGVVLCTVVLLPESAGRSATIDLTGGTMRVMEIPRFEGKIEIPDIDFFVRSRLSQATVIWPEQAFSLVGYMGWPNDTNARAASVRILRGWSEGSKSVPARLRQIQTDWARVADIFNLHYDLTAGGHQSRRGGASIGKAIELTAAQSKGIGASKANLWNTWKTYKDVAHLVTAATIISDDAYARERTKPFGEFGPSPEQLQPLPIAMLLPDFVLAVGLFLQNYGLANIPQAREEPMLDPETLWRIRPDMNVVPIVPPVRKIDRHGIDVLNARRAGNRGKSKR
jgi:hypothetical protein